MFFEKIGDLKKNLLSNKRFMEIFRFVITGGTCFIIDWGVMMLLMKFTSVPDWFSIGAGFVVSVIINYLMCAFWVFKGSRTFIAKIIFIGSSVVGLFLTEWLMMLFMIWLNPTFSKAIVAIIVMVWNYVMKKLAMCGFNFGKKKDNNKD